MQVAGPYDLYGGVRRLLPKTLKILDGLTLPLEWYLDELPVTPPNADGQPRPNPHGIFRILSPVLPRNAVYADADEPYRLALTDKADVIPFVSGTLSYEVTEQDIASVTSVVGTLAGTPNHTFVANVDYTFTVDSIVWTGTGDMPDNATNFTATYKHRMYHGRKVMDSRVTVRAILKCQGYQVEDGRHYSPVTLAAVLGSSLEMTMRANAAQRIVRPASDEGGDDEPYTDTMTVGRVISSGPLPMDASGSLAPWFVDFTLNISGVHEDAPVQAILDVPFEVELED